MEDLYRDVGYYIEPKTRLYIVLDLAKGVSFLAAGPGGLAAIMESISIEYDEATLGFTVDDIIKVAAFNPDTLEANPVSVEVVQPTYDIRVEEIDEGRIKVILR